MKTVNVNIAENPYQIRIAPGLLSHAGEQIAPFLSPSTRVALLASKTVDFYYRQRVQDSLERAGFEVRFFLMPTGEQNKTQATVASLYDELISSGFDRSCVIAALGGGITGDIAGFVAATLYRGLPFIQMPTTLLAQVDSSVGGKVGVNHPEGKNLIGTFYQPKIVLIDPDVLETLELRQRVCGMGEVLKYGFIRDAGFLDSCLNDMRDLLALKDMDRISGMLQRSVEIKARIVEQDEKEENIRMFLNFGHTLGHSIEKSMGYGVFLHGEAVIMGMCAALQISARSQRLDMHTAQTYIDHLCRIPLTNGIGSLDIESAMKAISLDKKTRKGKLNVVLLEDIGHPVIRDDISADMIRETFIWLKDVFHEGVIS